MSGVITEGSCNDLRKLSLNPLFMFQEVWWQLTTKVLLYCHLQSFILLPHPLNQTFPSVPSTVSTHLTSIYPAPLLLPWLLVFCVFSFLVLYWNLVFSFGVISLSFFYMHAFVWKHQKVTMRLKVLPTLSTFLLLTDEHVNFFANCSYLTVCVCVYILLFVYSLTFASIFCF